MPRIKNWSVKVPNSFAYARAGKRRHVNKQKQIEKVERQKKILDICVRYNYPFLYSQRFIRKRYIEEHGYISLWTVVYDLQEIFGRNYVEIYKVYKNANFIDFSDDIEEILKR